MNEVTLDVKKETGIAALVETVSLFSYVHI